MQIPEVGPVFINGLGVSGVFGGERVWGTAPGAGTRIEDRPITVSAQRINRDAGMAESRRTS